MKNVRRSPHVGRRTPNPPRPANSKIFRRAARLTATKATSERWRSSPAASVFTARGVLAARAAQRAQPGRITLFTQEKIYTAVASQLQAVMVSVWQPKLKFPGSTSAILIGPGLAAPGIAGKMKGFTQKLWRDSELPLVVDASALDWLPPGAFSKNAIRIITPHPGEAGAIVENDGANNPEKIASPRCAKFQSDLAIAGSC